MARQSRTIGTPAKSGGAGSARALGTLDRLASIGRENVRIARATAQVRTPAVYRLQIPASVSSPKYRRLPAREGAGLANSTNERTRMTANSLRESQDLAPAMEGLSRVKRSIELGRAAWADSDGKDRATRSALRDFSERAHRALQAANRVVVAGMDSPRRSDAQVSNRSEDGFESERAALARDGLIASTRMASSIRGVIPIRNLSQREFAEPAGNARGQDGGSAGAGITVHSSPTVVINGSVAGGGLAPDAIGALSAHREELFNQLKRESVRRERARF